MHSDTAVTESSSDKRPGLVRRLALSYMVTTLLILLVPSTATYFLTAYYLTQQLDTELSSQARFYAAYTARLAPDETTLSALAPSIVDLFGSQSDLTLRFLAASNGKILAGNGEPGLLPSQTALIELRSRSPAGLVQPGRDLPNRRYAAQAILVGDPTGPDQSQKMVGVVELSRSTAAIDQFLSTLRTIILAAVLAGMLITLLVSLLLARGLVHPIHDIENATRRIAAGDLDVRLRAYPSRELGRLAESINHMAEQLQRLEAARARFMSEISHDLRTPLTAVKGLLVNAIDVAEPGQRSSLELAEQEVDRLTRLVNQLLDFSRWQAGRLTLDRHPVDIAAVARTAVETNQIRAQHRNIQLLARIPADLPPVSADADRLQRAILNLLDNAIKFTPGGGQVTLTLTLLQGESRPRQDQIEVLVHDTGLGMSQLEQEKAFEPYHRGQGSGTGLGLSIARAIVEAHGGTMGIESSQGQGSSVWFRLPV